MNDVVIKAENVGKKYIISHQAQQPYLSIRDVIIEKTKFISHKILKPFAKTNTDPSLEEFWAVKNICFEIKQGDRVGVIGRNGAGKSTLLKILSRITEPSIGRIHLKGRVASLLEVGTGFHPELTGRENIYLNGVILGMSRAEIKKSFDEIVAFADIEKFLDTPVKRYSSGMYVRLAFAVAAHLESEILLVDEVLAVGDVAFQKKCLGKMKEVGKEGKTVIFVSHNMSTIQSLCNRGLLLDKGNLIADDTSNYTCQLYLNDAANTDVFKRPKQLNGKPTLVWGKLSLLDDFEGQKVRIDVEIFTEDQKFSSFNVRLVDGTGIPVGFGSLGAWKANQMLELKPGSNRISVVFSTDQLAIGRYIVSLDLALPYVEYYDRAEDCLFFELSRPAPDSNTYLLDQQWGFGSWQIPLIRII